MGNIGRLIAGVIFVAAFFAFSCATLSSAFVGTIVYSFAQNIARILGLTVVFGADFNPVSQSLREWIINDTSPNVVDYDSSIEGGDYDPFWWENPPDSLYWDPNGNLTPNPSRGAPVPSRRQWGRAAIADWVRAQGGSIVSQFNMQSFGVTSPFGVVRDDGWHSGTDFSMAVGTPILSLHNNYAQVIYTGWMPNGYGNYVVVSDGHNVILYAHLSSINVQVGDIVPSGSVLGASGNTGYSTGPHLHLEFMSIEDDQSVHFYDPCSVMICPGPR